MTKTLLFGLVALLLFSCKKEGCMDTSATNYDEKAKKDDGSCKYINVDPPVNPPVDSRDQYLGSYQVQDSIYQPGANPTWEIGSTYIIQITKGNTSKDTIFINNVGNYGVSKTAVLIDGSFVFDPDSGGTEYIWQGSGSFGTNNTINYSMKSWIPGPNPNIYGKGTKQ